MKGFRSLTFAILVTLTGSLQAQTKSQRLPEGIAPKESLFGERHSPETEKRIRLSENKVQTQAETIRLLEARVKELEAELAALKAGKAAPAPVPATATAPVPAP